MQPKELIAFTEEVKRLREALNLAGIDSEMSQSGEA